ncbi:hypothetical protein [Glutamicibacter sp.]|uniref:hypothetical protein n=1 Tax=Glutamicibacter sp. TaxID=1931995 RepID=UPI003D6B2C7A
MEPEAGVFKAGYEGIVLMAQVFMSRFYIQLSSEHDQRISWSENFQHGCHGWATAYWMQRTEVGAEILNANGSSFAKQRRA